MKAVLMSTQPKACEKIFSEEMSIVVRKTAPKLETPFKVYVYEALGKRTSCRQCAIWQTCPLRSPFGCNEGAGAVIGEFVCDSIVKYNYETIACAKFEVNGADVAECKRYNAGACLTAEEMYEYSNGDTLHGWHITETKLYDKPKDLEVFRKPDEPFHTAETNENGNVVFRDGYKGGQRLTRAPKSWCYVGEVER